MTGEEAMVLSHIQAAANKGIFFNGSRLYDISRLL
jgi:hypothetical protein